MTLQYGDLVRLDGRIFRICPAANDNIRFVEYV